MSDVLVVGTVVGDLGDECFGEWPQKGSDRCRGSEVALVIAMVVWFWDCSGGAAVMLLGCTE